MIRLTKMDGNPVMVNADWIQSLEPTPDTLITLMNGYKIIVRENIENVVKAFETYKKRVQSFPSPQSFIEPEGEEK